ncbi:MAG TPA: tetratricopeptide repeat protein [Pirellulales bacterium]
MELPLVELRRRWPKRIFSLAPLLLATLAIATGCDQNKRTTSKPSFDTPTSRVQKNDENLTYAIRLLRNVDSATTPDALAPIVARLNQWGQKVSPKADWKPDPMLLTLPEKLRQIKAMQGLAGLDFPASDGRELVQVIWLNEIARRVGGASNESLPKAQALFDWVIRNIQIEAESDVPVAHGSTEILLFGRGTAEDRAWIFSLLARQQGLNVVLLALPGKTEADAPKLWLPALLDKGELYLFDTRMGLPIAGPEGQSVATLAQAAADPAILRAMDADELHPYPVKAEDLHDLIAYVEGSPIYLSHRMQLVEEKLGGDESLILSVFPQEIAEELRGKPGVGSVRLWPLPFERLQGLEKPNREYVERTMREMGPFQQAPQLWQGRVLDLLGRYEGSNSASAMYQDARPSDATLSKQRGMAEKQKQPQQRAIAEVGVEMRAIAKQDASYWLGLLSYERGNYPAAIDYLKTRVLEAAPDGPWTSGARYNLGRVYEAQGQTDEAIRAYQSDHSPQRPGNLLRAKRLQAAKEKTPAKAAARSNQWISPRLMEVF